jgi:phosphoribosylformylglycinamidine synthase
MTMNNYHASINITLRKNILDVQGKTIEHALHSIEFPMISDVRIGKFLELNVSAATPEQAQEIVADACRKLIANPIIEDFEIVIK